MGKSKKNNIHLKEQSTQLGIIKLSKSEPSHLFLFSFICHPTHIYDCRDRFTCNINLPHFNSNTEGSNTDTYNTPAPTHRGNSFL